MSSIDFKKWRGVGAFDADPTQVQGPPKKPSLNRVKGVIGVTVAMAPTFLFVLEHSVTRIFRKLVIFVIITSFATSSTLIFPIEGCYR